MPKRTHLTDYLDFHAQDKKDKFALVCEDRSLSWKQLREEVDHAAASLFDRFGPSKKQRVVAILLPNGWQFVVTYLAVLRLGHIVLPIDPTYKKIEVEAILHQVPPLLLITNESYRQNAKNSDTPIYLVESLSSYSKNPIKELRLAAEEQIASLSFTSGTTGKPKVAPYTHANHIWNIVTCSRVWNWGEKDSMLLSLPLSHWYGLVMGLSGILYHGNTLYLHDWFDETRILEDLSSSKISMFTHVPAAYAKLLDTPGDYDLSQVRLFVSGGSAMPPAIWQAFKERFGKEILEVYGSSETGRIASNLLNERIPGSPGRPLPEVQIKFDEHSELLVKSPGVFPGYYKNSEATNRSSEPGGWWRTGDIGRLENGRVVLKGRIQEKIRKFNQTISPRDVEWAMHQHPKVKDIHVLGLQRQDETNDMLIYFIVGDLTEDEIHVYCKANLPYPWRPDKIVFVDKLPRTKNGKPRIAAMREMAAIDG